MGKLRAKDICAMCCATLVLTFAISGPIFAFFVLSCTSTATCSVDAVLARYGATCQEGSEQAKTLLHDEKCTVVCPAGTAPNVPELLCDDGTAQGASEFECAPVQDPGTDGGLVVGAVTGGLLRDVCPSAAKLECTAVLGGTAVFVQMPNVDQETCEALLAECQTYNDQFDWGEHASGICTLGCFAEKVSEEALAAAGDSIGFGDEVQGVFSGVVPLADQDLCEEGPYCFSIIGSCNEGVDGDYFRYPICAQGTTQWARTDQKHRLRYDDRSLQSQGGRWLIELVPEGSLASEIFGTELNRQPAFTAMPLMGTSTWDSHCVNNLNSFSTSVSRELVEMSIRQCTCTAEQDCNGNGVAVGSKEFGPHCRCYCNRGWSGEFCEKRVCRAPPVLNADKPSCTEGLNIEPGDVCTPSCKLNFFPSVQSLTCTEHGNFSWPYTFQCVESFAVSAGTLNQLLELGVTVNLSDVELVCGMSDCNNNGEATGWGSPLDNSCECECFEGYSGEKCTEYSGACPSPLQSDILNSAEFPCAEGRTIATECTPQCLEEYYPLPAVLTCTPQGLYPKTFACYGGPSVVETWCNAMRLTLLCSSIMALGLLILGALFWKKGDGRSESRFVIKDQQIEVGKDDNGVFNIIRRADKEGKPVFTGSTSSWMSDLPKGDKLDYDDVIQSAPENETTLAIADDPEAGFWPGRKKPTTPEPKLWALARNKSRILSPGASPTPSPRMKARSMPSPRSSLQDSRGRGDTIAKKLVLRDSEGNLAADDEEDNPLPNQLSLQSSKSQHSLSRTELALSFERTGGFRDRSPLAREEGPPWHGMWETQGLQYSVNKMTETSKSSFNRKGRTRTGASEAPAEMANDTSAPSLAPSPAKSGTLALMQTAQSPDVRGRPRPLALMDTSPVQPAASSSQALRQAGAPSPADKSDNWQMQLYDLKAQNDAVLRAKTFHVHQLRLQAENGPAAAVLNATRGERADVHALLQSAMQAGDPQALREGIARARDVMIQVQGTPASATSSLVTLLQVAEARLEHFEFQKDRREANDDHLGRVQRGEAANWQMTTDELRAHVEACNPQAVRAGLKAMLPISVRSAERLTLMHFACRDALTDTDEEVTKRRLEVVALLCEAKALVNAEDSQARTPLDLAIAQGGEGSECATAAAALRSFGLQTSEEARAEARAARQAEEAMSPGASAQRLRLSGGNGGVSTPPRLNDLQPRSGSLADEVSARIGSAGSPVSPGRLRLTPAPVPPPLQQQPRKKIWVAT